MLRKFLLTVIALAVALPSYAGDLIDRTRIKMPDIQEMNMGKILPHYAGTGTFIEQETSGYNLQRMKHMNPDFTTYPEAAGIIWLKRVTYTRSESGGMDITRLYVILGRRGLSAKWPSSGLAVLPPSCLVRLLSVGMVKA